MAVIHSLADLTPAQRDAAIDGFVDDVLRVAKHVVEETLVYPDSPVIDRIIDSLSNHQLPEPEPVLAKAVAWTLFMMQHWEKYRRLTQEELTIRAAARRLSDAIHGAP
jgi:hypothetical protein